MRVSFFPCRTAKAFPKNMAGNAALLEVGGSACGCAFRRRAAKPWNDAGRKRLLCQTGGKECSRAASACNKAVGRQRFARNAAITPVIMFPWRSRRKALAPAAFPFCAGNAAGFAFCRARSALEKVNPPLEGRALRNRVQRGHALWISRTGSGRSLHRQCCRRCRTRSRCRCRQLPRPAPQPAAGQR